MARYSNDPRWINVKYAATCGKCKTPLNRGARAFYYPNTKTLYCESEDCGKNAARDFAAHAFDEDQYNS